MEQDQRSTEQPGRQQNIEPGQIVNREAAQQLDPEPPEAQSAKPKDGQAADAEEHIGASPALAGIAAGAAAAAEGARVNFQSLANAYGDYTRKSLEQTRSFVEKLSGVRTIDKVMEAQAEFAKQSYENFVSGSQRICELQSELAKQAFKPLQRLANRSREQR
jgi:phasin family protein